MGEGRRRGREGGRGGKDLGREGGGGGKEVGEGRSWGREGGEGKECSFPSMLIKLVFFRSIHYFQTISCFFPRPNIPYISRVHHIYIYFCYQDCTICDVIVKNRCRLRCPRYVCNEIQEKFRDIIFLRNTSFHIKRFFSK